MSRSARGRSRRLPALTSKAVWHAFKVIRSQTRPLRPLDWDTLPTP